MVSVFFSYSHKDEALRDQLEGHLAQLKHQGLIDAWYDRRIVAGDSVDNAIFNKLEAADIILLLVSSDFISSAYCYSREMARAMERHHAGQARVIPVILRHCDWSSAPFGKLMAAPRDGKPVMAWPDRDEAFTDVAKQVRLAVESSSSTVTRNLTTRTAAAVTPSSESFEFPSATIPRSSNLRLKKEFAEQDKDDFLRSTFDYVCNFFDGSCEAIGERNPDVTSTFERIDSRRMAALLYRGGKRIAECSVRLEGLGRENGIAYSYSASASQGSFNEMLNVVANDQHLFMKSMGMAWTGGRDRHLSQEGAAEFLWNLFIKSAQS